jgi:hypothetical protein
MWHLPAPRPSIAVWVVGRGSERVVNAVPWSPVPCHLDSVGATCLVRVGATCLVREGGRLPLDRHPFRQL